MQHLSQYGWQRCQGATLLNYRRFQHCSEWPLCAICGHSHRCYDISLPMAEISAQPPLYWRSARTAYVWFTFKSRYNKQFSAGRLSATNGPRVVRKQCPVIAFYSCRNCIALLLTAGFNNRAPPGRAADRETLMNPQSLRLINAALLAAITLDVAPALAQNNKPNVVFILADNVGYGDLGPYGGGELRGAPTPRIDELAREGLRLTQYLVEPGCTPSRAALMTGQYSIRNGLSLIIVPGSPS